MSHWRLRPVLLLERFFKYFNVDIAQAFDFFSGQALVHKSLLHLCDFDGLDAADQLTESLFENRHVFPGVQGLDNFLECRLLFLRIAEGAAGPVRGRFARCCGFARLPVYFVC